VQRNGRKDSANGLMIAVFQLWFCTASNRDVRARLSVAGEQPAVTVKRDKPCGRKLE
jgi:hypothetical protein